MQKRTNEEWIAELQSNHPQRQDALVDLRKILLDGLYRGLISRVNTNGPEFAPLAEDFVHESILKILANLSSFAGRSRFTTWAHKITSRVALTELRRKRWKDRSLDEMVSAESPYVFAPAADTPSPEAVAIRSDLMNHIQRIIQEELTDKQREAMLTVPIGGMPIALAAEKLGMNRNALYKLIHDARLRIKKHLLIEGLTPESILATFG